MHERDPNEQGKEKVVQEIKKEFVLGEYTIIYFKPFTIHIVLKKSHDKD